MGRHLSYTLLALLATVLALGCVVASPSAPAPSPPDSASKPKRGAAVTAFVDVRVVPMDREQVLENHTVLVEDGRIAALGPSQSIPLPEGTRRIEGRGRFLIPGLADLHIHLASPDELISYLAYGVTTVANLSGSPELLTLREKLARGELAGPTLYTTGPTTDGYPPRNRRFFSIDSPEDARRAASDQKRAGYDFIKVYSEYRPDTFDALLAAAKEQKIAVVGHIPRNIGAERALSAGQAMIAHGEEYYFSYFAGKPQTEKIPAIVEATRAAGAAVIPMLCGTVNILRSVDDLDGLLNEPEARYVAPVAFHELLPANNRYKNRPNLKDFAERNRTMLAFLRVFTKALSDAGVPLLVGTDASVIGFPGHAVHQELRELRAAGLSPYQTLAAATKGAGDFVAKHVPAADRFGVITKGARADLVLLDSPKNPLEDIEGVSTPAGVMARGRWFSQDELAALRERTAAPYGAMKALVTRFDELLKAGKLDETAAALAEAQSTYPGVPLFNENVLGFAGLALLEKDPASAVRIYTMGAAVHPRSFMLQNMLGKAHQAAGDPGRAAQSYRRSLELSPNNAVAVKGLAELERGPANK